jgi:hypothetical protein
LTGQTMPMPSGTTGAANRMNGTATSSANSSGGC